jgi:hypothetical protein
MKTTIFQLRENGKKAEEGKETISVHRAQEIMQEEGIEYKDEELKEILQFISKVLLITATHFERIKERESKIISINTNPPHETKNIPLHSGKYGRTG